MNLAYTMDHSLEAVAFFLKTVNWISSCENIFNQYQAERVKTLLLFVNCHIGLHFKMQRFESD